MELGDESKKKKSKILVIGCTGYIGRYIVEASVKNGHPTYAFVRNAIANSPNKDKLVQSYQDSGVTLLYGDWNDHGSLVKAIQQVDVVISPINYLIVPEQLKIIAAIKDAGNVKRYLPAEFGNDVDRFESVEPATSAYVAKTQVRRAIEASGIPYTFIVVNCFALYFLSKLCQPDGTIPPRDKVLILGDGNPKAIFVDEEDVATYTIKAMDDPRTLNKIVYLRPPTNFYSINEVVACWENKIGKSLERIYMPEEEVLKTIHESSEPLDFQMAIIHSIFIRGCQTKMYQPSFGLEAGELYPEVKCVTVDECLDRFV